MQIVVLGGGGRMGRIAVRALAEDARVTCVLAADQREEAAERTLAWLGRERGKARAVRCDVRDADALAALLAGADAVLNATDYPFNLEVMRAALAARVPYADLGGLFHMTRRQYELDAAFRDAGVTAALGAGSTPGITNVLARLAADSLDRVERLDVRIGGIDPRPADAPFVPPYSIRTILDECTLPPMVYRNGRWSELTPLSEPEEIDFPAPVGRATAVHTLHSEVALFPVSFRERGLRHASFKIAFPPEFLAQLKLLVGIGLAGTAPLTVRGPDQDRPVSVAPREVLVALLARGTAADGPTLDPMDCEVLRVVVQGTREGTPVELIEDMVVHPYRPWKAPAADLDVGVPLAIAGLLLASGAARLPGTHGAERVFDPRTFLDELARFGLHARELAVRTVS